MVGLAVTTPTGLDVGADVDTFGSGVGCCVAVYDGADVGTGVGGSLGGSMGESLGGSMGGSVSI